MSSAAGPRTYAVRLGLGAVQASLTHLTRELGTRVDEFAPTVSRDEDGLWLTLAVPAQDLWLAVLTAMAVVTGAGYPVERLHAQPSTATLPDHTNRP